MHGRMSIHRVVICLSDLEILPSWSMYSMLLGHAGSCVKLQLPKLNAAGSGHGKEISRVVGDLVGRERENLLL